jgi:hypothetical protein
MSSFSKTGLVEKACYTQKSPPDPSASGVVDDSLIRAAAFVPVR